jgi:hypothetical protein
MAKLDKSLYSKEEVKRLMKERRKEKKDESTEVITDTTKLTRNDIESDQKEIPNLDVKDDKNFVLCLKHGTKYSAEYVNRLWSMVSRHCTLDFEFVCLTDDPKGLNSNVKVLELPNELSGWWCKPYMFSNDLPIKGTVLYMDLDVVIADNIDKLFTWRPNHWCIIRDFTRKMRPTWQRYNSSVVRFQTGELDKYWQDFKTNRRLYEKRFYGDQDWLWDVTNKDYPAALYPDEWIMSWKWEIRQSRDLTPGLRGERKLRTVEHVTPPTECCITVFHGDPNPEHCDDPWVVKNWI